MSTEEEYSGTVTIAVLTTNEYGDEYSQVSTEISTVMSTVMNTVMSTDD